MDPWMECFDAAIHHFREAGHVFHRANRNSRFPQRLCRSPGGEDFDPHGDHLLAKIDDSGFVTHGNESPADHAQALCDFIVLAGHSLLAPSLLAGDPLTGTDWIPENTRTLRFQSEERKLEGGC